ncbi:glycosyltransferase [Thiocystis violascens]|uniref:Putative glycosyltransferase n=1 Tax=Thiocystis violascens (strain ATCC 17096 / DSM 198 / 6111) TaxID=765911 RepID=I3YC80_THIV6|nr:glycosyltransferase [Thiocystis violascens]AFL74598.1 putative glycosyltransferase [Thiocystis violascens DSM 198]
MAHQYHRHFDPNAQDSLAKLARMVRPGSEVLDVGAGPGVLASYLMEERACYVDGIEYDPTSAEQGQRFFRALWVADLNLEDPARLVGKARYDFIVCADILEHLVAPEALLPRLAGLLKPDGQLLLSVPNVAHAGLIAELIGGELRYRQEGLLDRTHLRFFTRASLRRLLDDGGLRALTFDQVKVPIEQSEFSPAALTDLAEPVRECLLAGEDAETYQFIVSCVPREAGVTHPGSLDSSASSPVPQPLQNPAPVDIVIPVHAGLTETQACIESVLGAPVVTPFELVVIDDLSPEPALRDWLRGLAGQGRLTLLENAENQGYVVSVNRGMALHPERDVVLLNSDTEVANDWLDRLRAAAYQAPDVGTVTPFANSGATICSYPLFCVDNPLPEGWDVAALDALMRATNPGAGVDLPTSVGYCTYLRRDCLRAVGPFDAEAFGRGYGEENDFSMRARYRGWRHRLAADVFVVHRGGVSFGDAKAALVAKAQLTIRERHPAYDLLVAEHVREDPARDLRERVDWQRLARSPRRRLLFVSHDLGGGVERHLRELAQWLEPWAEVLVLRPAGADGLALSWQRGGETATLTFQRSVDFDRLLAFLRALRIERLHVHHLLGLEEAARRILDALAVPYDLTVHDFLPLCPRINLVDSSGHFCDQPPEADCARCLAADPHARSRDIAAWRALHGAWLLGAARVLAPSRDTAARLRRVWPRLEVRTAAHDQLPHPSENPPPRPRRWSPETPLRIVVLGQLSPVKGLDLLAACARDAASRNLPLEFHLVGYPLGPLPAPTEAPLIVHGPYQETELPARLHFLSPHLAWFPALWPETWSYTLGACLQAGLPVAAPLLGAFPERLASRPWSCLLPIGLDATTTNERLLAFASRTLATLETPPPPVPPATAPDEEALDYRTEYLVPPAPSDPGIKPVANARLAEDFFAGRAARPRPFALRQQTGQPLIDQIVRLREENEALRGGVAERDAVIAQQLSDADRTWSELANHRAQLSELLTQQRAERAELLAQHRTERAELLALHRAERAELVARIERITEALRHRDAEIEVIYRSLSWKLTRPVRGAGRALRATRSRLAPAMRALWQRLPIPPQARFRAKSAVFRATGPLFRGTPAYAAWVEQSRWVAQGLSATAALKTVYPTEPAVENLRIPGGIAQEPRVSVIIPVYNKLDYTLACLDSIARQIPKVPIEVLVVDDGSSDATQAQLEVREDLRYLRNPDNLGFVGSCNRGAQAARGEFLFFLNNDTVVLEGWLDTLVQTLIDIPDAGLVGGKLIYPDGRLQEAGGIIWADASGWNWGRLADPAAPEFNFLRDADYCSGAALLVRRALFEELGGFDARYAPAYYEDTDLAFAVRARGLRVLYQPLSQVIHYEGVTAGTDLTSGMKAYQVRNLERFREKWAAELATHGDAESRPPRLSADRRVRARMLVIDACTPTPDQDSGSLDMLNYLRLLTGFGYRVTFIPASDLLHFGRYTAALQALGVECLYYPHVASVEQVLESRGTEFDAVMLMRVTVAHGLIDKVRAYCPRARIIFNTVDLHFLREQRLAELETGTPSSPSAAEMKQKELAVMARADTTIVISPVEQALLAREAPGVRVRVIPILREIPGRDAGFDERSGLIFVGGFRHPPNIDAMLWFQAEIWPLLRARLPDLELSIVGSHMVPEVKALEGNGIHVLGFVEDIGPIFARARLSVAPLRYGAGQKGKVVTSLGYGVPGVLTRVAAEGLGLGEEEGALLADEPADFAEAVIRLYRDAGLWQRLSDGGLARVEREFSVAANRATLAALLAELDLPAV